jgi:hypothetical protein
VTRSSRRSLLAAFAAAALGLTPLGCGNGRPPGVATQPGDSYVELSDLVAEKFGDNQTGEIKIKVHYVFPDDLPHPDAWFQFTFEINGGQSGVSVIRKQGRELNDEGDIDIVTTPAFVRRKAISFGVKVQQSDKKTGPWHDVSDKLLCDF